MIERQNLGVSVMPLETRLDTILYLGKKADELGYKQFALPETWSYDMTSVLAALAVQTEQINLGTGILGVWGRSPATVAMAAATINLLSNGRFELGIGASTPQIAEGLHDVPYSKPYSKLRQTLTQIRALLNGERVPVEEEEGVRPLKLNLPPQPDIPICLAATSPKSIQLAGELADGWLPFLITRDKLGEMTAILQASAAAAGRPQPGVFPAMPTIVAPTHAEARAGAAWFIAFYIVMMGDVYRTSLMRQGYEAEVTAVIKANEGRKPAIVPPEAEVLLEQLTIFGTPDEVPAQMAKWVDAGATRPGLLLLPNLTNDQLDFTLSAF